MLFNSFEFLFLFLPVTLIGFFVISKNEQASQKNLPIFWLVVASLFFYSWWNPKNLPLIIISIIFNYSLGHVLSHQLEQKMTKKIILLLGICFNLGIIGYFKYANFFVDNLNHFFDSNLNLSPILLPLAISFFTFQQIAYLVDAYQGETKEYSLLKYVFIRLFFFLN